VSDILACLVLLVFYGIWFPPQGYEGLGRVRRCDTIQLESIQVSGAGFGSNWESSKDSCGGDAMAMTKTNKELDTRTCHGFNNYRNQKQRDVNLRVRQAVRGIMSTLYTHPCPALLTLAHTHVLFTFHVKSDRYLMHAPTTIGSGCVSLHLYP